MDQIQRDMIARGIQNRARESYQAAQYMRDNGTAGPDLIAREQEYAAADARRVRQLTGIEE